MNAPRLLSCLQLPPVPPTLLGAGGGHSHELQGGRHSQGLGVSFAFAQASEPFVGWRAFLMAGTPEHSQRERRLLSCGSLPLGKKCLEIKDFRQNFWREKNECEKPRCCIYIHIVHTYIYIYQFCEDIANCNSHIHQNQPGKSYFRGFAAFAPKKL